MITSDSRSSKRRIAAGELFALADTITKLAAESGHILQNQAVTDNLNAALAHIIEAAKSAAFQEAREAYNRAKGPDSEDSCIPDR